MQDIAEENNLFPDYEVISFSQPRSTPASDSLKTAETVVMASRLINVETSNHSPSVTVSIFDALAEILTSTPKPVISISTTPKPINLELNISPNNNIGVSTTETYSSSTNDLSERENSSEFTLNVQTESQSSQVTTTKPVQTSTIVDVTTISTASTTEMSSTTSLPLETNAPLPLSTPIPQIFKNDALSTIETPTHALASTTTQAPYPTITQTPYSTTTQVQYSTTTQVPYSITTQIPYFTTQISMRRPFATLVLYSTTSKPTTSTEAVFTVTPHDFQTEPFASYDDVSSVKPNTDDNTSDMLQYNITPDTYNNINNYVDESSTSYAQNDFATISTFNSLNNDVTDTYSPKKSSELTLSTLITSTTPVSLSTTNTNIDSSSSEVVNTDNYKHNILNSISDTLTMNSTIMSSTTLPSTSTPFNVNNDQLTKEIEFISSKIHNVLNASSHLSGLSRRAKLLQDIEKILLDNNVEALQKVMGIGPVELDQLLSSTDNTNMSDTTDSNNENSFKNSVITNNEKDNKSNDILNIHENLNNKEVEYSTMSELNFGFTEYENVVTSDISIGPISSTVTDDSYISTSTYNPIMDSSTNTAEVSTTSDVLSSSSSHITQNLSDTTPSTFKNILQTSPNYQWIPPFPTAWRNKPSNENFQSSENPMNGMSSNPLEVQSSTTSRPKKDYYIYGVLPNNTVVRKNPNDNQLEILTEASPFIIFGVLPNNTIIRKFPNGTHVPKVTQRIDVLPIDPRSLKNPQSPVYRNPESIKPINNDIVSTNEITQNNKILNSERLQITAPNTQTMTGPVYNTMMTV